MTQLIRALKGAKTEHATVLRYVYISLSPHRTHTLCLDYEDVPFNGVQANERRLL